MSRFLRYAINSLLLLIAMVCAYGWYLSHPAWRPEYQQGQALVARVENFKRVHGRLPETHEPFDPAADDSGSVFYQKESADAYTVWFGLTLGESYAYNSATRSWQ